MSKKNKPLEVQVVIPDELFKDDKTLKEHYDKNETKLVYEMNPSVPDSFLNELVNFFNDEVIGPRQIVKFNPLLDAVNQLQELKKISYDPMLSDELEAELIEKCFLNNLSYDIEQKKYIFAITNEAIENKTPEQIKAMESKIEKEIEKALAKQHNNSYQFYKDAKKITGAFNTALTATKKELKDPYLAFTKKVDNIYNVMKSEYDDTVSALDTNFKTALEIEQEKKEAKLKAKMAEEIARAEQLEADNKANAEKLMNQLNETEQLQLKNKMIHTVIGGISKKVATNVINYNLEALANYKRELLGHTLEKLAVDNDADLSVLDEQKLNEVVKEFEDCQAHWISLVQREIKLRMERKELEDKLKRDTANLVDKETDDDVPFSVQSEVLEEELDFLTMTAEKRFIWFKNKMAEYHRLLAENQEILENIPFDDEINFRNWHGKVMKSSFPQMLNMAKSVDGWLEEKYNKWKEHKK